jgi:hypothetical protein
MCLNNLLMIQKVEIKGFFYSKGMAHFEKLQRTKRRIDNLFGILCTFSD